MDSADEWTKSGSKITAPGQLAAVRKHMETVGPIVVEWWHYRGGSAPTRLAFEYFEDFEQFLRSQPVKGDAVDVYPFPSNPDQRIAEGKIPNEYGEVPQGGPY